jgi:hypothetical protein
MKVISALYIQQRCKLGCILRLTCLDYDGFKTSLTWPALNSGYRLFRIALRCWLKAFFRALRRVAYGWHGAVLRLEREDATGTDCPGGKLAPGSAG